MRKLSKKRSVKPWWNLDDISVSKLIRPVIIPSEEDGVIVPPCTTHDNHIVPYPNCEYWCMGIIRRNSPIIEEDEV